jgi:hypothetical protein
MHAYTTLVAFLSLAALGAARDNVNPLDVPAVCRANSFCVRAFVLSGTCNAQNSDDSAFVSCVCNVPDAQSILNSCATCAQQYDNGDDDNG